MEKASGKYIAFLDSDDLWEPTKLEKQVNLLNQNQEIGLCFAGVQKIGENNQHLDTINAEYFADYTEALLLYLCIVSGSCSSAMLRKSIITQIGKFDTNLSTCADWDYWLRASLVTNFAPINEYLVKYRIVSGSMSSDPYLVKRDIINVLDKFYEQPNLSNKYRQIKDRVYSNHLMILSGEFLHSKKIIDSFNCLINGLRMYPQNFTKPLNLPIRWTKRLFRKKHSIEI
jgi:glycosyltransferase involved in cell wall biosynthesis